MKKDSAEEEEIMQISRKGILALFILFCVLPGWSFAEGAAPIGFGYVNNVNVALRREINGDILSRLPKDSCVWIREEKTDAKGILWYHIHAGSSAVNESVRNESGWMKAEFIDAGEKVWHDIVSVSSGGKGLIALRKDGSALLAGHAMVNPEGTGAVSPKYWNDKMGPARQVVVGDTAEYYTVSADGGIVSTGSEQKLFPNGKRVWLLSEGYGSRLAITDEYELVDIHHPYLGNNLMNPVFPETVPDARVLSHTVKMFTTDSLLFLVTAQGELFVEQIQDIIGTMPDWSEWTDIAGFCGSNHWDGQNPLSVTPVYAAVKKDGSVMAWPEILQARIKDWNNMEEIRMYGSYVVGLKKDGTVVSANLRDTPVPDVSSWKDIIAADPGNDYCVGLKSDGTLLFAGDHLIWEK